MTLNLLPIETVSQILHLVGGPGCWRERVVNIAKVLMVCRNLYDKGVYMLYGLVELRLTWDRDDRHCHLCHEPFGLMQARLLSNLHDHPHILFLVKHISLECGDDDADDDEIAKFSKIFPTLIAKAKLQTLEFRCTSILNCLFNPLPALAKLYPLTHPTLQNLEIPVQNSDLMKKIFSTSTWPSLESVTLYASPEWYTEGGGEAVASSIFTNATNKLPKLRSLQLHGMLLTQYPSSLRNLSLKDPEALTEELFFRAKRNHFCTILGIKSLQKLEINLEFWSNRGIMKWFKSPHPKTFRPKVEYMDLHHLVIGFNYDRVKANGYIRFINYLLRHCSLLDHIEITNETWLSHTRSIEYCVEEHLFAKTIKCLRRVPNLRLLEIPYSMFGEFLRERMISLRSCLPNLQSLVLHVPDFDDNINKIHDGGVLQTIKRLQDSDFVGKAWENSGAIHINFKA